MATPPKDPKDYLPRGRPSSYRPEFAQALIEYFSRPAWDVQDEEGNTVELDAQLDVAHRAVHREVHQ